jgi:5-methylcytosine-specific restriction endonuclease McrA
MTARCGICQKDYTRRKPLQSVCSLDCALLAARAKRIAKLNKAQASKDRKRKKELKSISQLKKEAQSEFNKYIRLRDIHKPCISCGKSPYIGQRHASHFRPRSTSSQHSYRLDAVHTSCQPCNTHLSGNLTAYRTALVAMYSEERVQALENDNRPSTFTRGYLIRMKEVFRKRVKHLTKLRNLVRVEPF